MTIFAPDRRQLAGGKWSAGERLPRRTLFPAAVWKESNSLDLNEQHKSSRSRAR